MFEMLMLTGFLYAALARLLPEESPKKKEGVKDRARRDRRRSGAEGAKPRPIARRIGGRGTFGRVAKPWGCANLFRSNNG